ncbi:HEX2 protein-like protein [Stachybotrys elegans]|uniref:HEX2 protein-like protein n=1 Tax=Stachybotrys elegans TaxID=80388 RepID=A0A8K0WVS3_9HYPO|nr:HEX2 protein-like protein [Stachybotrys elegans]
MAVVLSSDDSSYFAPSSLRRSHSQPKLDVSTAFHHHTSTPTARDHFRPSSCSYSESAPSSPPSSPRTVNADSTDLSYASTPASNFSVASDFEDALVIEESAHDHFSFPSYDQPKLYIPPDLHRDYSLEPPPSPRTGDSFVASPTDQDSSDNTSRPGTPEFGEHAEDDTAATTRPTRQVDYLSHEWKEEDIWSSWRYVVARRGEFPNSARLENASWRTWVKAKNNLKTISPEELNWLKDCDVTWLYGPLQQGPKVLHGTHTEPSSSSLSKADSLVNLNKKPILKKRSMSEVMLRKSLSTASLLKQATAAVQAQETRGILRPSLGRANTDYVTYPFSSRRASHGQWSSLEPSTESSGITSPSAERKHIHFNEQVEQCIAVDVKGDDEDEVDTDPILDSDSDDGVVMKPKMSKKRMPLPRRRSKVAPSEGKIIAMLPSTTLKYREDTPEPPETAMKHSTGVARSPVLSPSSSQETLRPAKRSTRFFIYEEDDEDIDESIPSSASGWSSPPSEATSSSLHPSLSSNSLGDEVNGMRRTASGMLMPYEEGDTSVGDGIFGRVIDTVNTARDIAHVIWNVGWRT